jgi:hypothetical protein
VKTPYNPLAITFALTLYNSFTQSSNKKLSEYGKMTENMIVID